MRHHAAAMRVRAVFPQINSLPRAEREFAVRNRNGHVHGRERGADVRGHVVVAFGGVIEDCIAIGHEPREAA